MHRLEGRWVAKLALAHRVKVAEALLEELDSARIVRLVRAGVDFEVGGRVVEARGER